MGNEGIQRDFDPRSDRAAQVIALGIDSVVGDRGAKVDHNHRPAVFRIRGERVGDAVRADVLRVFVADPNAGLDAWTDHYRLAFQVAARCLDQSWVQIGHHAGDHHTGDDAQLEAAEAEEVLELHGHLVRGSLSMRGHTPVGDKAVALKKGERHVRVANVDREEHQSPDSTSRGWEGAFGSSD